MHLKRFLFKDAFFTAPLSLCVHVVFLCWPASQRAEEANRSQESSSRELAVPQRKTSKAEDKMIDFFAKIYVCISNVSFKPQ